MDIDFDALLREAELNVQQPFHYVDYYKQARDEFLGSKLNGFPDFSFQCFSMHFIINSVKLAPLVFAILERISQKRIEKSNVDIQIDSESELIDNLKCLSDLYNVVRPWKSLTLFINDVDFKHPTSFGYFLDFMKEKHPEIPFNQQIEYIPKKKRTKKKDETTIVDLSKDRLEEILEVVVQQYLNIYGKNKEVAIHRLSIHRIVVMIENSLVLDFRLTPSHLVRHEFGEYMGNPFVTIQELTYNELFKFNFAGFRRSINSDQVALYFYHFYSLSYHYYLGKDKAFNAVDRKLPELRLKQRLEDFPGETHHFIILRMESANGEIKYGVAETKDKVHSYILKLCKELESKNSRSVEIYSVSCLPIERNVDFLKAFLSWKGEKKRWRLENKFSYYYEDRSIKDETESYYIKEEILKDAYLGQYESCEFGTYTKPLNRWKSEELVYNIVKKLYKDYQVLYQYKPFFLATENGNMSYDVYICGLKIAIEYQGKQHFEPVEYFGGEDSFQKQQERDRLKAEKSEQNGIKLVYVNYWEDITIELIRSKVEGKE